MINEIARNNLAPQSLSFMWDVEELTFLIKTSHKIASRLKKTVSGDHIVNVKNT